MNCPERPLDLNRPSDARIYIQLWVESGAQLEDDGVPFALGDCTEEEQLRIAKQLFMYADTRQPLGRYDQPH